MSATENGFGSNAVAWEGCELCPVLSQVPPSPQAVILSLTRRCQLQCRICDYWRWPVKGAELDVADWMEIVNQLAELDVERAVVTGGEPLMSPALLPVLCRLNEHGIDTLLNTNGIDLTIELAAEIAHLQCLRVVVTLHGERAETHDAVSGVLGSFARTLKGLAALGPELVQRSGLNVTVLPENVPELPGILDLAAALGAGQVRFYPVYRSDNPMDHPLLREALDLGEAYQAQARALGIRLIDCMPWQALKPRRCFAPFYSFIIASEGEVYPCIPRKGGYRDDASRALANVAGRSLVEIWDSAALNEVRRFAFARAYPECAYCPPQHTLLTLQCSPCWDCSAGTGQPEMENIKEYQ